MRRGMTVALLLTGALRAGAATPQEEARAALLRADTEWAAVAAVGKDVEGIVAFWTDDAVIYPPREAPVVGKDAIRAYVSGSLKVPGFSIRWKPVQVVVSEAGDIGYTTGTNSFTFPDAEGRLTTAGGRYLTIWRKGGDGRWRCVVDFWNEAPPAAAGSK